MKKYSKGYLYSQPVLFNAELGPSAVSTVWPSPFRICLHRHTILRLPFMLQQASSSVLLWKVGKWTLRKIKVVFWMPENGLKQMPIDYSIIRNEYTFLLEMVWYWYSRVMPITQIFNLYWVNIYYLHIGTVLGINTVSQVERHSIIYVFRGTLHPVLNAMV